MVQMLYGFILGFSFCYLYEKYGSVMAPVTAHVSSNILSVLLTELNAMEWMSAEPLRIGIITVICASAASTMYVLIQRIEEKPERIDITVLGTEGIKNQMRVWQCYKLSDSFCEYIEYSNYLTI